MSASLLLPYFLHLSGGGKKKKNLAKFDSLGGFLKFQVSNQARNGIRENLMCDMRRSLMTCAWVLIAIVSMTTSCSRDEFSGSIMEAKQQAFESTFISEYGMPIETLRYSCAVCQRKNSARQSAY